MERRRSDVEPNGLIPRKHCTMHRPSYTAASLLLLLLLHINVKQHHALPLKNSKHFSINTTEAVLKAKQGWPCLNKYCEPPKNMKYKRIQNVSPRIQWDDAGGYCGSMAVQDVTLERGLGSRSNRFEITQFTEEVTITRF